MPSHVRVARPKTVMPSERTYLLRGLLFCGVYGRRMGGNYNHGKAHYRCTFREQYAQKNGVEHPRTVYLREDKVVPALDEWLGQLFDPDNLDATCKQLAAAYEQREDTSRAEQARHTIAECDQRLAQYRAALDAGADAPTATELRGLIEGLGDMVAVLTNADPKQRAELYEALGLRLTWHPEDKRVLVEAQPARVLAGGVGGGT